MYECHVIIRCLGNVYGNLLQLLSKELLRYPLTGTQRVWADTISCTVVPGFRLVDSS